MGGTQELLPQTLLLGHCPIQNRSYMYYISVVLFQLIYGNPRKGVSKQIRRQGSLSLCSFVGSSLVVQELRTNPAELPRFDKIGPYHATFPSQREIIVSGKIHCFSFICMFYLSHLVCNQRELLLYGCIGRPSRDRRKCIIGEEKY